MAKTTSPASRRRGRTLEPATTPVLPTPEQDLPERRFERIAARAREIYEARGGEHGQALDDWLQAEREIDLELEEPLAVDEEE
jgi:hypothetical protein